MRNEFRDVEGFTLIEVVVAIVVLTVGVLALAASAAAAVRSMTDGARVSGIARAAEGERERAFASVCAAASGSDSVAGGRVTWTASPSGASIALDQTLTLSPRAANTTTITALGACR